MVWVTMDDLNRWWIVWGRTFADGWRDMAVRNMKVGGIMHCVVSNDVVVIVVIDGGGRNSVVIIVVIFNEGYIILSVWSDDDMLIVSSASIYNEYCYDYY